MSSYDTVDNRIQASLAWRAFMLLSQYDELMPRLPEARRYDATLTLCILQTLLTNCQELLDQMSDDDQLKFGFREVLGAEPLWGLTAEMVTVDGFHDALELQLVLRRLRNALSHPVPEDTVPGALPATGYTSPQSPSKRVTTFTFTMSPFVVDGQINHEFCTRKYAEQMGAKLRAARPGAVVSIGTGGDGAKCLYVNGVHHLPVFTMTIDVASLRTLAGAVAEHVAQPLRRGWTGDFKPLDAA